MLHPNLNQDLGFPADQNGNSEGFYLDDLASGAVVEIEHNITTTGSLSVPTPTCASRVIPRSARNRSRWKLKDLSETGHR